MSEKRRRPRHLPGPSCFVAVVPFLCLLSRTSFLFLSSRRSLLAGDPRDLQLGTAALLREGNLPWRRPHEGIPVLLETTFAFQRAKPIVVSPFENPFPTRGRGPWTPTEGSGQSLVSSHTIDRPRCTDRQLLGLETLLSSYHVLRTTQGCALVVTPESQRLNITVIPSE